MKNTSESLDNFSQESWRRWRAISIFSTFNEDVFIDFKSVLDNTSDLSDSVKDIPPSVGDILKSQGGTYGISGPRGMGKTWYIQGVVNEADSRNNLPSSHDAETGNEIKSDTLIVSANGNKAPPHDVQATDDTQAANEIKADEENASADGVQKADDTETNNQIKGKEENASADNVQTADDTETDNQTKADEENASANNVQTADDIQIGLGLWIPVPSKYEPTSFIGALTDLLARKVRAKVDDVARNVRAEADRKQRALSIREDDAALYSRNLMRPALVLAQNLFDAMIFTSIFLVVASGSVIAWVSIFARLSCCGNVGRVLASITILTVSVVILAWIGLNFRSRRRAQTEDLNAQSRLRKLWNVATFSWFRSRPRSAGLGSRVRTLVDGLGVFPLVLIAAVSIIVFSATAFGVADWYYPGPVSNNPQENPPKSDDQQAVFIIVRSAAIAIAVSGLSTLLSLIFTHPQAHRFRQRHRDLQSLKKKALGLTERLRYSSTERTAIEFGTQGSRWVPAVFKSSRSKERAERQYTLESLVQAFTELAENTEDQFKGPVVIGIDELDKIVDLDDVRSLLRDIKGIFAARNVYFLVSVSSEAANSLNLGAVRGRDEFNSSFSQVLDFRPLNPLMCTKLVGHRLTANLRTKSDDPEGDQKSLGQVFGGYWKATQNFLRKLDGTFEPESPPKPDDGSDKQTKAASHTSDATEHFPEDIGRVIGIFAGGVPREVLRLSDLILKSLDEEVMAEAVKKKTHIGVITATILEFEAAAFGRHVASSSNIPSTIKTEVFKYLRQEKFEIDRFPLDFPPLDSGTPQPPWILEGTDSLVPKVIDWEKILAEIRRQVARSPSDERLLIQDFAEDLPLVFVDWSEEAWRKLLVRIQVGRMITLAPEQLQEGRGFDEQMQRIIVTASESSEVSRILLEEAQAAARQLELSAISGGGADQD